MMDNYILLYLITRLDGLKGLLCFFIGICMAFILIKIINKLADDEYTRFEDKHWMFKYVEKIATLLIIVVVLIPSKSDVVSIYTGSVVISTLDAERSKDIVDKTIKVIEKKLDDDLKKE